MPNTIAENLQRLIDARADIADAITAKGGTVTSGDGFEEFPADIATIPSGGGSGGDSGKPVRFIDYDGTVVDSYTTAEFAELSAMPNNPSHEGLTAQGWNWSLTDAKAYVAKYGMLDVGQMYITDDGRTRLYVRMQESRLSPILKLYLNANSELDIDWGDGTAHSTFTSTTADYKSELHEYASAGDYVVSIGVTSGSFAFPPSSSISTLFTAGKGSAYSADRGYLNTIEKLEIGSGVTSIAAYAFSDCFSLSQVTIPESVTSIGTYAFSGCYSLSQVTIPENVTSIAAYAFSGCCSLLQVTIPESVTSIGTYAFSGCCSLSQVTIPESVITIRTDTFNSCFSLSQVTIPESVTSIVNSVFIHCYSLLQVTIPESVTSIGTYAFYNCCSVGYVKFENQIPPTISGSSVFVGIPTDCKILVPRGTLSAYTSATNYPNPATYTYEEYDV